MTTIGVVWADGVEFDLHVVRGPATVRLDEVLLLLQDVGEPKLASEMPRPADVAPAPDGIGMSRQFGQPGWVA